MGSQTCRISRTCLTSPTRQSPNTDSCSFAPFVPFRGLKISTEFLLFPSHERHKSAHERKRANNSPFLLADTIRLLADSLIASADSIRKPADRIRKMTKRIRKIFIKNGLKSKKIPQNLHFPQDFARFYPPAKSKNATKILAESEEESFSQFFRRRPIVNFWGSFRSHLTGRTGRISRKGC